MVRTLLAPGQTDIMHWQIVIAHDDSSVASEPAAGLSYLECVHIARDKAQRRHKPPPRRRRLGQQRPTIQPAVAARLSASASCVCTASDDDDGEFADLATARSAPEHDAAMLLAVLRNVRAPLTPARSPPLPPAHRRRRHRRVKQADE